MNVLVVGAGSIGARRARIIRALGHNVLVSDSDEARACALAAEVDGVVREPNVDADLALVCTPPATHAAVVNSLELGSLAGLYVEKPLALNLDDVNDIEELAKLVPVTMGACNLRFMTPCPPPIAKNGKGVRWTATMGQHAKHWSPEHQPVSMILDSIHDLDLLQWYAGPIRQIVGLSRLDMADAATEHVGGGHGRIRLDRTTDPPVRTLTAHRADFDWSCDLWPPDPEMYDREMHYLLDRTLNETTAMNPLSEAAAVCRWALEVA